MNPENPVNPACPMESVFVFYSIGVEYEVHSSGVAPADGTGVRNISLAEKTIEADLTGGFKTACF